MNRKYSFLIAGILVGAVSILTIPALYAHSEDIFAAFFGKQLEQNEKMLAQNAETLRQHKELIDNLKILIDKQDKKIAALEETTRKMHENRIQVWSAKRTGGVTTMETWQTIPGLIVRFHLDKKSVMHLIANGVQLAPSTKDITTHIQYRFSVNGIGQGEGGNKNGQRVQVNNGLKSWWNTWTLTDEITLDPNDYTIEVQAIIQGGAGEVCAGTGPGCNEGTLHVFAVPKDH